MKFTGLLGAPIALFMSAAVSSQVPSVPPVIIAPPAPPVDQAQLERPQLRGASVFVYSFLDVREDEFGTRVLAQFHNQLIDAFKDGGVSPQLQLFADTFQGSLYVSAAKVADGQRTVEAPPVLQTIAENVAKERTANARYRLLVLPASFEMFGAWRHYTIRWILMDAATDVVLWKGDYNGRHMVIVSKNENAEDRGRKLVEGGLSMMKADHLL